MIFEMLKINNVLIILLMFSTRYICKDSFGKGYFCDKNEWKRQT